MNASTGLPTEIECQGTIAANGRLYAFGGINYNLGTNYDDVYATSLDTISHQARYSRLVDAGTVSEINQISFNGKGSAHVNVGVHKACGVGKFTKIGNEYFTNTSGTVNDIFPTSARLLLSSFEISADYSSTFPEPSNHAITDFTTNYEVLRAPPEDRLRGGNYFSGEQLQPYDTLEEAPVSSSGC